MTEMGVRKPKRRLGKIVRNVRLKNPMGIKIGRLKKPIVKKLMGKLMGKETFILCGF